MYIPKEAVSIMTLPKLPIRMGVQGPPGNGKTWSALTFPNLLIMDLDNKLGGWREKNPTVDVSVIPFWDRKYIEEVLRVSNTPGKPSNKQFPANIRDAVKFWLQNHGPLIEPEQTLVLDSFTALNDGFDAQTNLPHEKVYNRQGEEDGFAFWKRKLAYNTEICQMLKGLRCNVVAIFHEQYDRNENMQIIGVKPLIQGQSADKVACYFTDFYRQRVITPDGAVKIGWKMLDPKEDYVWQTCKDSLFQHACKSSDKIPAFVKANYQECFCRS